MYYRKTCICIWYDLWTGACTIPVEEACENEERKIKSVKRHIDPSMFEQPDVCEKCLFHDDGWCTLDPKQRCKRLPVPAVIRKINWDKKFGSEREGRLQ